MRYNSRLNQRCRFLAYAAMNLQRWKELCNCGYDELQIIKKTERLDFWLQKYKIIPCK